VKAIASMFIEGAQKRGAAPDTMGGKGDVVYGWLAVKGYLSLKTKRLPRRSRSSQ